ncbi:hypothetical protein KR222_003967 [Zaprionus bogoriensis]|nr:hypothetical protein KR222_003967 [Zaprionus bogoriensis]
MLHRRLALLLTISYYHVLGYGLMPTMLHIGSCRVRLGRPTAGYLIYSGCLTGALLMQLPFMLPSGIFGGYMRNNIVLQWSLVVGMALHIFGLFSCYGIVWLQRRRLRHLFADFLDQWRAHWPVLRRVAGAEALRQMQSRLAKMLLRLMCVNYAMLCCSLLMQYRLLSQLAPLQMLVRASRIMMLSVARLGFLTLLVLLSHQFEAVQLALQALRHRAGSRSHEDLRRLVAIHGTWLQLARRAFCIYDIFNTALFVNMFALSITILYHAVQFGNKTIKSDAFGDILGYCLIISNVWHSILVMNMLDHTIHSCNDAGKSLQQFNDLRRSNPESQREVRARVEIEKLSFTLQYAPSQLEVFASRLRIDRLAYKMCHLIVLDRAACLAYIGSVLNNVIILMQFDIRRRQESGNAL